LRETVTERKKGKTKKSKTEKKKARCPVLTRLNPAKVPVNPNARYILSFPDTFPIPLDMTRSDTSSQRTNKAKVTST
jgi:hypothetical protein